MFTFYSWQAVVSEFKRQTIPHDSRQELSLRNVNIWIGPLECYGPKDFRGLMCEIKWNVIQGPKLR